MNSEKYTIQMMKLFQENVKKDISNTNSVIKLVQDKLKDCDFNLNSLKQISKELNIDFANIENKLNDLKYTFNNNDKKTSESTNSLSRNSSLDSLNEDLNENNLNEALKLRLTNDDMKDLENSYIYVTLNKDGCLSEDKNWLKRSSISSTASSNNYMSDENSNDSDFGNIRSSQMEQESKAINENLIQMLLQSSSMMQVGK